MYEIVNRAGEVWDRTNLTRELAEASAKLVAQAAEIERLRDEVERLRAALLKIKRGSVWNCDIEAFIDAALALPASLRNRMAVLVENIDVDLDSAIDGDVAL
jgi:hypothetical protein